MDFWAAKLQCDKPGVMDFTMLTGDCLNNVCYHSENAGAACTNDSDCVRAILHVYGENIVPSKGRCNPDPPGADCDQAEYEIRVIDSDCPNAKINNDFISPPLRLTTSRRGDVCGPFVNGQWSAPDGQCLVPDDVMAVLSKVALHPLAPSKTRADVVGVYPPEENLSPDLIVALPSNVMRVLGAAALQSFPYQSPLGPWPCPEACHGK